MAKLIALSPVSHDGEDYQEGDEFEVKDKSAIEALVKSGSAIDVGASRARKKAESEGEAPADPAAE